MPRFDRAGNSNGKPVLSPESRRTGWDEGGKRREDDLRDSREVNKSAQLRRGEDDYSIGPNTHLRSGSTWANSFQKNSSPLRQKTQASSYTPHRSAAFQSH
eukprot:CAMPEP_0202973882 /NCGR_PEP_ID=MMETSP1396-20130829/54939_1 /ASSEMBLY_ACC=CAM_ASM_000872 /TAXON_ID= /ORGANISM="Pseudokeronopsis sp., Strain Brazil" /LENGTH=100 /DNA_ID=CAMNT_0049706735 /DNA_START=302 /DNA_END=605 /DNA_ORIENTATION=-